MELQQRTYSCGPASLRAAFYMLGRCPWEKSICKYAGTTPDGTDESGLKRAIEHYKFRYKEFQTTSVREAAELLKKSIRKGYPVLLCVDRWDHWCSAVGMLGKKLQVFDPSNSKKKKKYSGLRLYNVSDLINRWGNADPDGAVHYYGIILMPPKE